MSLLGQCSSFALSGVTLEGSKRGGVVPAEKTNKTRGSVFEPLVGLYTTKAFRRQHPKKALVFNSIFSL